MTSFLHAHPWLLLVLFAAAIFALDAILARVADRWFGPPARPAGADPLPASASAEDMGVGFVEAEFDEAWGEYLGERSR